MKRSTREILKKCLIALLAVGAIGGTVALGNKMYQDSKATTKSLNVKFEVGGLAAETGAYENVTTSLYTKEAFKAKGLKVLLDIDANIEYQVFFYDEADTFISASEVLKASQTMVVPENALARIEISPIADPGTAKPELGLLDVYKYSKQIEVVVDKNQAKVTSPGK